MTSHFFFGRDWSQKETSECPEKAFRSPIRASKNFEATRSRCKLGKPSLLRQRRQPIPSNGRGWKATSTMERQGDLFLFGSYVEFEQASDLMHHSYERCTNSSAFSAAKLLFFRTIFWNQRFRSEITKYSSIYFQLHVATFLTDTFHGPGFRFRKMRFEN